jgi:DNA-binding beta-propeller fold protein YncE
LERTVPIVAEPRFLRRSSDGRQLLAVGERGLTLLSLPALHPVRDVPIEGAGINWTSDAQPGPANEVVTTADGKRGLVTYENSSKLLILDLTTGTKIGSTNTGRKGVKLLNVARATALTASSYYAARDAAIRNRQTTFFYYAYSFRGANTTIALRSDGGTAYVLNTLTGDVTVVDTANGNARDKLPAGGHDLVTLPGGRFLGVVSDSALQLIDTASNTLAEKLDLPGLLGLAVAPDGSAVAAVSERSVLLLDPASGKVNARLDSFVGNTDRLFVAHGPSHRGAASRATESTGAKPADPAKTRKK